MNWQPIRGTVLVVSLLSLTSAPLFGSPAKLINPNQASESELMSVPGVSTVVARRIIDRRPYQSVDDLVVRAELPIETVRVAHERFTLKSLVVPPEQSAANETRLASPQGLPLRLNVNTATAAALMRELAVDRKRADRIILGRPYPSVAEFLVMAHLPPEMIRRLEGRLVVSDAKPPAAEPREAPPDPRTLNLQRTKRPPTTPAAIPLAERLDINTATADQLARVCDIQPMDANEMISKRPFHSLRELGPKLGYSRAQIERVGRCVRADEKTN